MASRNLAGQFGRFQGLLRHHNGLWLVGHFRFRVLPSMRVRRAEPRDLLRVTCL